MSRLARLGSRHSLAQPLNFPRPSDDAQKRTKLLVLEFWGLGDLTFSTPLLQSAVSQFEVTLVGKAHARPLLAPTFPGMHFIGYDAPWSAYRGKYDLRKWNWPELMMLVTRLRRERFDAALSVRNDPRDHLLMRMVGARRRYGFPRRGSHLFLTDPRARTRVKQHKVEDWRDLGRALELPGMDVAQPRLEHSRYRTPLGEQLFADIRKPVICLHPGARIAVRRWPEKYFEQVIQNLRQMFDFHLILVPDPDGYGSTLVPLADTVLRPLTIRELVDVLGRVDLLLCNDSGPGHLAASCGRPAIPIFGPTDPDWFRPWGDIHHLVIRDICPIRPCFDYCRFPEPYCLTRLQPQEAWPEIGEHIRQLISRGVLPRELLRNSETTDAPGPAVQVVEPTPAVRSAVAASLDLAFSVADQNVKTTKSIGIYNFSLQLARHLAVDPHLKKLTVFSNETISPLPEPTEKVRIEEYNYPVRTRPGRIFWDQWGVIQRANASGREWLFLPKGFTSFLVEGGLGAGGGRTPCSVRGAADPARGHDGVASSGREQARVAVRVDQRDGGAAAQQEQSTGDHDRVPVAPGSMRIHEVPDQRRGDQAGGGHHGVHDAE